MGEVIVYRALPMLHDTLESIRSNRVEYSILKRSAHNELNPSAQFMKERPLCLQAATI